MSKGVQLACGATLVSLLLGWYAVTHLAPGAAFTYFQDLDSFRAATSRGAAGGSDARVREARVHGYVVLGSIERDLEARRVAFRIQNDPPHRAGAQPALEVVYASLETPDLFLDGAEVVVEGRLDGPVFHADRVMAKCPSKFEPAADGAPARQASF